MTDTTTTAETRRGRPPGTKADRPDIKLPNGEDAKPRVKIAGGLGVSERTVARMRPDTTYIGGVAYCSEQSVMRIIARGMKRPRRGR